MDANPDLISAAIAGDVDALAALLRQHAPQLRSQLQIDRRWASVLDVDDILQVTFTEAFLRITSFVPRGPDAFLAWISRIADNNLRDAIKGLQRLKRPPPAAQARGGPGDSVVELFETLRVTSSTPSRALASREMVEALEQALALLPADYATAIRKYDLEGRSIDETAALVNRRPGAVHMLRARGHGRLRELLGENPFLSVSS